MILMLNVDDGDMVFAIIYLLLFTSDHCSRSICGYRCWSGGGGRGADGVGAVAGVCKTPSLSQAGRLLCR